MSSLSVYQPTNFWVDSFCGVMVRALDWRMATYVSDIRASFENYSVVHTT